MSENEFEQIEVDVSGWFAVCNAENKVEAVLPTENYAAWYLEKNGWMDWKILRVAGKNERLFSSEQEHRRTENDEN